jgi:hypothetical protein
VGVGCGRDYGEPIKGTFFLFLSDSFAGVEGVLVGFLRGFKGQLYPAFLTQKCESVEL